jgi:hypothetical protein
MAQFDVFLCHNSVDKPEVIEIAKRLRDKGIKPWLDIWEIRPGLAWQDILENQINDISAAVVFIGSNGLGPWQEMELRAYLRKFVKNRYPVIPVLLASAPKAPELPAFLEGNTWVDFRRFNPDPMDQLIWGITGKRLSRNQQLSLGITDEMASPESYIRFFQQYSQSEKTAGQSINVLLCYVSDDSSYVKQISEKLLRFNIHSWLNISELPDGIVPDSLVIFIGNNGFPWEDEEIEGFIYEFIESKRWESEDTRGIVVSVILPDVLGEIKFPGILRREQILDFRKTNSKAIAMLADLITGKPVN